MRTFDLALPCLWESASGRDTRALAGSGCTALFADGADSGSLGRWGIEMRGGLNWYAVEAGSTGVSAASVRATCPVLDIDERTRARLQLGEDAGPRYVAVPSGLLLFISV